MKLVVDVETFRNDPKDGKLLGVSFAYVTKPDEPVYVSLQHYDFKSSTWIVSEKYSEHVKFLKDLLTKHELIGHNYAYDKLWIDSVLNIESNWVACTRVMWHLASAPSGPRPYGLKDAEVELLGYPKRGDSEIEAQIKARGGKPGRDIYLADPEVIAKYARSDAKATAELYNYFSAFYSKNDYWWMLEKMTAYSWLLQWNTSEGINASISDIQAQVALLADTRAAYGSRFTELATGQIEALESIWAQDRAAKYQTDLHRLRFLDNRDLWKRFNLSSDKDKRQLFYEHMKLPVIVETEGGLPSTSMEAIRASTKDKPELKELIDAYTEAESAETLLNSFAKPWLNSVNNGRLQPRFNPCGTVSYRISGFKPYLLNAPFDERELMSCLRCDEGWEGLHADFVSVEPAVTAHYSQDPSLLKVFRDGLGDVYLDLARTLFPNDLALQTEYDPMAKVTGEIKDRFKTQRKIAKVIQLAVQYTGTKYTVHKNLSLEDVPSTLASSDRLVKAYWIHFAKVAAMNEALFSRYAKNGHMLRNVVGRIIRVPSPRYKDLPNRFIQSSAHDLLTWWVMIIARMVKNNGLQAKPMLIDCHDSTSWQAPKEEVGALQIIFVEALKELNETVKMTVPVKVDMKRFTTLAGLKGKDL